MKRAPVIQLGIFPGANRPNPPRVKPFPWVDAVLLTCALGGILGAVLHSL